MLKWSIMGEGSFGCSLNLSSKVLEDSPIYSSSHSNNHFLQQEEEHLSEGLMNCNYPIWALNRVKMKMNNPAQKKKNKTNTTQQNNNPKPYKTVPYYKGLSESVKKNAIAMGFKSTLEEVQPSKTSWWLQRTKILC